MPGRGHRGFTLSELVVTLAVLGTLLAVGLPTFSLLQGHVRSRSASHLLSASLAAARLAAANRRVPVTVCPRDALGRCRSDGVWDEGWMTFLDPDRNGQPDRDDQVLQSETPGNGTTIRSTPSRSQTRFFPDGRASGSNLSIRVCSGHRGVQGSRIVLSNAGRMRIERQAADDPGCPGA